MCHYAASHLINFSNVFDALRFVLPLLFQLLNALQINLIGWISAGTCPVTLYRMYVCVCVHSGHHTLSKTMDRNIPNWRSSCSKRTDNETVYNTPWPNGRNLNWHNEHESGAFFHMNNTYLFVFNLLSADGRCSSSLCILSLSIASFNSTLHYEIGMQTKQLLRWAHRLPVCVCVAILV